MTAQQKQDLIDRMVSLEQLMKMDSGVVMKVITLDSLAAAVAELADAVWQILNHDPNDDLQPAKKIKIGVDDSTKIS